MLKVISLRRFSALVKELTEPTEVTLRNRTTGEIQTLGVWFPKGTEPKDGTRQATPTT